MTTVACISVFHYCFPTTRDRVIYLLSITPESYEYRFSDDESYSDDESDSESEDIEEDKDNAENDQQSWCSWLVMATLKSIGIGFIAMMIVKVVINLNAD